MATTRKRSLLGRKMSIIASDPRLTMTLTASERIDFAQGGARSPHYQLYPENQTQPMIIAAMAQVVISPR
jgi:hypothetical protein